MEADLNALKVDEYYALALKAYEDGDLTAAEKLTLREAAERLGLTKETKIKILNAARQKCAAGWVVNEDSSRATVVQPAPTGVRTVADAMREMGIEVDAEIMAELGVDPEKIRLGGAGGTLLEYRNEHPEPALSNEAENNWKAICKFRLSPQEQARPRIELLTEMLVGWGLDAGTILATEPDVEALFEGFQCFRAFRSHINTHAHLELLKRPSLPSVPANGYAKLALVMPYIINGTDLALVDDVARITCMLPERYAQHPAWEFDFADRFVAAERMPRIWKAASMRMNDLETNAWKFYTMD